MFLRRLILEDVRSIERLDMPFVADDGTARKWTLLLGENGCGKSSVLRSIALLLSGGDALPELLGDPDRWVRLGSKAATMRAELATADGEVRHVELGIRRGDSTRKVLDRNRRTLDQIDRAIEHADRNYFVVGYGVSRRLSAEATSPVLFESSFFRSRRARNVATLFSADAALNPLEGWAMDLDYRRGKAGLKLVKEALAGLLPEAEFDGIDRERRALLFRTADGRLPLAELSDGYQNVAAWCGDLLYRLTETFEDRRSPLAARGLLLVDELDLHLHPVWKRQLVSYLTDKLPNFQVVATTHSPLTAHQAGPDELFVLRREQPRGSPRLFQFKGEPRTLMLHQLLMSPVFGLETVDSHQVEQMRDEYRQLRDRTELTPAQKRQLGALSRELATLPDWNTESATEQRQIDLLERLEAAVAPAAVADAAGPKRAAARRGAARPAKRTIQPKRPSSARGALVRLS